jgi:hypothetical protein
VREKVLAVTMNAGVDMMIRGLLFFSLGVMPVFSFLAMFGVFAMFGVLVVRRRGGVRGPELISSPEGDADGEFARGRRELQMQ